MCKGHSFWLLLAVILLALAPEAPTASAFSYGICYSQPDGAVFPLAGTCTSYVYCLGESPYALPCPSGTGFSTAARGCVTKSKSNCVPQTTTTTTRAPTTTSTTTPRTTSTRATHRACIDNMQSPANVAACVGKSFGDLVPYPGDCSKFLVCDCEYPTVKDCAQGTWFNDAEKVCDWPQNVNCSNSVGTTSSSTTATLTTVSSADPTTTVSTEDPLDFCVTPPAGIDADKCRGKDDGTLYRYPYNCNAYVNCTQGCPVLTYCKPEKVFNEVLRICDTPDTSHCETEPLPPSTTPDPTTPTSEPTTDPTTESTTESTPSCTSPLGIGSNFCARQPTQDNEFIFYAFPGNCSSFIMCVLGCAQLDNCPPGKLFNSQLGICDLPGAVNCQSTDLPPDVDDKLCVDYPTNTLFPYEEDCSRYIQCLSGKVTMHSCPSGWFFNEEFSICDDEDAATCFVGTAATPSPSTTASASTTPVYELCLDQKKGTSFPYTANCQLYHYCWGNDTSSLLLCPLDNWYNPSTGDCGPDVSPTACREPIETTPAPGPAERCQNQSSGQTFPIESDCTKYVMCAGPDMHMTLNCPANNYYNPVTGKCGPEISPTACREASTTVKIPHVTASTTATPSTAITKTTSAAGGDHHLCSSTALGVLVPYPDNCSKYIQCAYPAPVAFTCPADLYFSEVMQRCGFYDESDCTLVEPIESTTPAPVETTTVLSTDVCWGATNGESRPYPANCEMFIRCTGDGTYTFELCGWQENYDAASGECSAGAEPDACRHEATTPGPPPAGICAEHPLGTAVAYPGNCTKYIICELPIPVAYLCGDYLEFNAVQAQCMPPEGANCSVPQPTMSPPTETTTEEPPSGPCYGKPYGALLPYPNNCSKYIECLQPISVGHDCPDGLEFNAEQYECTEPELANCSIPTTTTREVTTSPETTPTTTATETTNPCANKVDGTVMPYPNDCTEYIYCYGDAENLIPCMPGTYFNPDTGLCTSNTSATACRDPASTTAVPPTSTTEAPTTMHPSTSNVCCGQALNTHLAYPGDCGKYIICAYPIPTVVICAEGYSYDETRQGCGLAAEAQCPGITTAGSPDTRTSTVAITMPEPNPSHTSTEQAALRTSAPTSSTSSITTSTTKTTTSDPPVIHANESCKTVASGSQIAYAGDCTKYNFCFGGDSIVLDCGNHWYFNPQMKQCVPPSSYKCPW